MRKLFTFIAMTMVLALTSQASSFMMGANLLGSANDNVRTGQLFVLGEVNGLDWAPNSGVPMATTDQNIFTATITVAGTQVDSFTNTFFPFGGMLCDNSEGATGYNYFSFSTKLSKDPIDWASMAAYRIGSTEDGYLLTPELMGTDIPLGGFGTAETFKIAAGTYDLTVNLDAQTLVFTEHVASIQGDVNGDKEVSVADINAIIELILSGSDDMSGDVNGDNEISVGDINALIELILVPKERTATPTVELIREGEELWARITGEGNIYINGVNYGTSPVMYHVADQSDVAKSGKFRVYAVETDKTRSEDVMVYWSLEPLYGEIAQEPVITYDAETYTVTATSEDNVVMLIDGVVVDNPYTFTPGTEEVTYVVTAYAWADGKENSPYATLEVTVPAEGSVPTEKTATPEIIITPGDDAYTITAEGDGVVILYADGEMVENPYVVARGEEDVTIIFTATAQEEGKLISETAETAVLIPAKEVEPTEKTATPEIIITPGDDAYTITAEGDGVVILYADGEMVENPYVVARGEEDVTIIFTATAQEEGKLISETAETVVLIPAKEVIEPTEQTATPVINVEHNADTYTITATGDGEVHLYADGVEVENPYVVARGEENVTIVFTATAQEEGKLISETATLEVTIYAEGAIDPSDITATPVIVVGEDEDVVVITATGNGEIHMYIDGVEVENPYTFVKDEEDHMIVVTATAQEEGKLISDVATKVVVIPAKEMEEPHDVGYWLVLIDKDGNEVWEHLTPGADTDYQTSVTLNYGTYGTFDYFGGEERPNVSFYFVVDGVVYGAAEDGTSTVLGQALDNPLYEGMNYYTVPVGYKYVLGIAIDDNDEDLMYVYAAQGGFVGVDELNAEKAVAGVRYFNLAGQEMQEANGVTIVVTTYTDGTTSAVKVMK